MTGEVLDQTISSGSGFAQSSSTVDHDESLINPPLVKKKRNLPGNPGNYIYIISKPDHLKENPRIFFNFFFTYINFFLGWFVLDLDLIYGCMNHILIDGYFIS